MIRVYRFIYESISLLLPPVALALTYSRDLRSYLAKVNNLYFIGDEITQCYRDISRHPSPGHLLGSCYVSLIASYLQYYNVRDVFKFTNYGHYNLRSLEMNLNFRFPILDMNENHIITISLGIENLKKAVDNKSCHNLTAFEQLYEKVLIPIRLQAPNGTFILIEPYSLPGDFTRQNWNEWKDCLNETHEVFTRIGEKFGALIVPMIEIFFGLALQYPPADNWTFDGFHPSFSGHEIIAREWLKLVDENIYRLSVNYIKNVTYLYGNKKQTKLVFLGDSITEGSTCRIRNRSERIWEQYDQGMGDSFPFSLCAYYGSSFPNYSISCVNHGITSERLHQVEARLLRSIAEKPNVLNILVGVNDVQFRAGNHQQNYSDFEALYDKMLSAVKTTLPETVIVICEPFGLPGDLTAFVPTHVNREMEYSSKRWRHWKGILANIQNVIRKVAEKHGAVYVSFQPVFDEITRLHPPADNWLLDGIHPTRAGIHLMRNRWVDEVERQLTKQ